MAEDKFFNNDMSLDALMNGRHWDDIFGKPKVKTFDPIYGPTPFKPTGTIVARFERQICRKCKNFSFAFEGIFVSRVNDKGEEHLEPRPDYTPYETKQIIDLPIPTCYSCP